MPASFREGDANAAARGKKLVETIGCKGCHGFADGEFSTPLGKEKDLVPNLKDIAAKTGRAVDLSLDQRPARLSAGHAHAEPPIDR